MWCPPLEARKENCARRESPGSTFTLTDRSNYTPISWSSDSKWIAYHGRCTRTGATYPDLMCCRQRHWRPGRSRSGPECASQGFARVFARRQVPRVLVFSTGERTVAAAHARSYRVKMVSARGWSIEDNCVSSSLPNGLTWSADDKRLIYSTYPLRTEGSRATRRSKHLGWVDQETGLRRERNVPAVLARGGKLAYSSLQFAKRGHLATRSVCTGTPRLWNLPLLREHSLTRNILRMESALPLRRLDPGARGLDKQ